MGCFFMDYLDEKPKVAKRQPQHKQKRKNNHKGYFGQELQRQ